METRTYFPNVDLVCPLLLFEDEAMTTVLDITDASFRAQIRTNCSQNRELLEVSTANGKIAITPVTLTINGSEVTDQGIEITLTALETLAIYQGSLGRSSLSDIEITFSSGNVVPKIVSLELVPDVPETRDYTKLVRAYV